MKSSNPFFIQIVGIILKLYNGEDCEEKQFMTPEKARVIFEEILVSGKVYRHILKNLYNTLVAEKNLIQLEELAVEQKNLIRERGKTLLQGRQIEPEHLMEVYKSLHVMDLLRQQ